MDDGLASVINFAKATNYGPYRESVDDYTDARDLSSSGGGDDAE